MDLAFKKKLLAEVPLNTGAVTCAPPTGLLGIRVIKEAP